MTNEKLRDIMNAKCSMILAVYGSKPDNNVVEVTGKEIGEMAVEILTRRESERRLDEKPKAS